MSVLRSCVVIVLVAATSSDAAPVLEPDAPAWLGRPSSFSRAFVDRTRMESAAHAQPSRDERARRTPASSDRPLVPVLFLLGAMCIGVMLYFLPSMVAMARGHENKLAIVILNLLLGWTFLGWVGALVWSLTVTRRTHAGGGAG